MNDKIAIIKRDLELVRPDFDQLNLTGLNFYKEMEFAVQILEKNTYLSGANIQSIQNAIKNIALTGLSLNPVLKYCYLIPRKEKQVLMCLAEPSYMGLCKILTDTGSVIGISATIVYEKEVHTLKIKQGMNGYASHEPYMGFDSPGKPIACYSIAVLPNGMEHVELLRPFEWEDIKQRSESVKSYNAKKAKGEYAALPTWFSDESEMIRKTTLKKHYKYLPKTERAEMIGHVIDLDNQANGIDFEKKEAPKTTTININNLNPESEEDQQAFKEFIDLFDSEVLPAKLRDGSIDVAIQKQEFIDKFENNALPRVALDKWGKFMQKAIAHFTANPVVVEETEAESQETEEDF